MAVAYTVGEYGEFAIALPFSLTQGVVYTITSVSDLATAIVNDVTIKEIYTTLGLSDDVILNDVINKVSLVTFSAKGHLDVRIPSSYIQGSPNRDIVNYKRIALTVELGMYPEEESFDHICEEVSLLVSDYIGTTPVTKVIRLPYSGSVTWSRHLQYVNEREANILLRDNTRTKLVALQREYDSLKEKYDLLEAAVISTQVI